MLEHLLEREHPGRPSDLTYVESSPRRSSKHIDDTMSEKNHHQHQLGTGGRHGVEPPIRAVAPGPHVPAVYHNGEPVIPGTENGSVRGADGASNVSGAPRSKVSRASKNK